VATTGTLVTTTDALLATTDSVLTTTGDHRQPLTTMDGSLAIFRATNNQLLIFTLPFYFLLFAIYFFSV